MNEIDVAAEKLATQEESQLSCLIRIRGKVDATSHFSLRRGSYKIGIIDHKTLSDEELVRSFVELQDEQALSEIVDRYGDKIYGLALRIIRNPNDVEDVLQEVFVTLIEKLNTFGGEAKFSTWLYGAAANTSFIHLRAEKNIKDNLSLEDYTSYNESGALKWVRIKNWSGRPDEVLPSKEGMEIIERAVNGPPVAYRVVFHLRDVEGLTTQKVAKVLGLSLTAVKNRVVRGRLFLRNKLSDLFYV
jgi:RNA polymerase sigma-70 factor (ECF subfamily)